ncbi:MAG: hypothetical protein Q3980_12120 [Turicibacter sp.]|nr:hypothetical protein [Turicibacter sp.]
MNQLELFKSYIVGDFNNEKQIEKQPLEKQVTHPYAEHVNRVVDDKIENLPDDINGVFILEESYYTTLKVFDAGLVNETRTRQAPHLFFLR